MALPHSCSSVVPAAHPFTGMAKWKAAAPWAPRETVKPRARGPRSRKSPQVGCVSSLALVVSCPTPSSMGSTSGSGSHVTLACVHVYLLFLPGMQTGLATAASQACPLPRVPGLECRMAMLHPAAEGVEGRCRALKRLGVCPARYHSFPRQAGLPWC